MATKKTNLSPEVKARLRRAVLGEITEGQTKSFSAKPAKKEKAAPLIVAKPALRTLKKIVIEPKKTIPAKTLEKKFKKIAVQPIVQPVSKVLVPAPRVASWPKIKTPLAKRDWEKTPKKEESLEKLFKASPAWKKPSPLSPFLAQKQGGLATAKPKSTRKPIWLKLIGVIILLVILLVAFDILGLYQLGFKDALSYQVAKVLQLPAGYVASQPIGLADYLDDVKLLTLPLSQKREGLVDYAAQSASINDQIFYRLAANALVQKKLKDYNKSISAKDLDNQVTLLLQQTGGQSQAEKLIKDLYGLNVEQFKNKVLGPLMAREALLEAVINDESQPITKTAKDRAEEVLKLARASSTTNFEALAKQYSDDESSVNTGGDLGWVVKGQLDPAWESVIFNTATGTVAKTLVKSHFGFHVIKVEQKLTDKSTGAESVKLRHILIKVDIDQYIKDLLDKSRLVKYIK